MNRQFFLKKKKERGKEEEKKKRIVGKRWSGYQSRGGGKKLEVTREIRVIRPVERI